MTWIGGGYYIFSNRFEILSFFYRLTLRPPAAGTQNQSKAYFTFIEPVINEIKEQQIDLNRMRNSCPKVLVRSFRPDENFFTADWLQIHLQKKDFSTDIDLSSDLYWKKNRPIIAEALYSLLESTIYAYEIPAEITESEPILVPQLIEQFSAALCNPYPAIRIWGNYAAFQEQRAYNELLSTEKDIEFRLPFPAERELLMLSKLKNRGEYIMALRSYLGGPPPADPNESCTDFRLVCIAPNEALRATDKLIYASPKDRLGMLFLNHGRIYLRLSNQNITYINKALDRFEGATEDRSSEISARLEMGAVLAGQKRYNEAYRQLSILQVVMGPQVKRSREFRVLARQVLMGSGRFVEADCFSFDANRGGARPACIDFVL
ncbi:MAG: hypothetical protein H3C43_02450 [Leptonema sp. (in: Bacteria)]|nr:hypothetical protein [Leptonema sp. (in: bacteria)]